MTSADKDFAVKALGLKEALTMVRSASNRDGVCRVGIACGFTALHLTTLVEAYASGLRPDVRPEAVTGTYGDLAVSLTELADHHTDGIIVLLDWPDLDPRLSVRNAGAPEADIEDMVATSKRRLTRIGTRVAELVKTAPVVLVTPGLDFPAYETVRRGQAGRLELALRASLAAFVQAMTAHDRVRVLLAEQLATGPDETRYDPRMHLRADFPLTVAFASRIASDSVGLLLSPPPKKGLITDLDDTMWRGLVGEVGADAVSWSMESGSQNHAVYQQLLRRLSHAGALVAVASKNEQTVVDAALKRADLIADAEKLFPVLASWGRKSLAVAEILKVWNIGPGDVVFVDDNPLELAEISRAFPEMVTLQFKPDSPGETLSLIREVDSLFARDTRTAEDALRVDSLRSGAAFESAKDESVDYLSFLTDAGARLELNFGTAHGEPRTYELVQKTNQFNLNGRRHTLAEWDAMGTRPGAVTLSVRYVDRFGDLGVISVLTGVLDGDHLVVDSWVLSCRAFSRAVETHMLATIADHLQVKQISFQFEATTRNQPLQNYFTGLTTQAEVVEPTIDVHELLSDPFSNIHEVDVAIPHVEVATTSRGDGRP